MQDQWFQALLIVTTSIASAIIALMVISMLTGRHRRDRADSGTQPELEETAFLFDDQDLIDATNPAQALMNALPMTGTDWTRLSSFLAPRFDNFAAAMAGLAERGRIELSAAPVGRETARLRLIAENVNGLARITLIDPEAEGHGVLVDGLSQRALEDELELLRHALDKSPALIWRETLDGTVNWANRAYLLRSGALESVDDALIWPLPRLFTCPEGATPQGPKRLRLEGTGNTAVWFDIYRFALDSGTLSFALPADATVRAEKALRDFVQTLTKTFADLPIGLAIFDRQRQLQLFNPALLDLTQLGPDFLSARPTLYAFLDRLREARMMPEPKDYRSWRLQMTEFEKAAAAGFHTETWNLPGGQTFRVTGRPHPDGAVAFLFEDISSEMSLTRRFRAEIEMTHDVLDQISDAVAVFHASGELALSNRAYARLWRVEPELTLGQVTIVDTLKLWQEDCEPTALWGRLRDHAWRMSDQSPLRAGARLRDGRALDCTFSTLHGGALMARFTVANSHAQDRSGQRPIMAQ